MPEYSISEKFKELVGVALQKNLTDVWQRWGQTPGGPWPPEGPELAKRTKIKSHSRTWSTLLPSSLFHQVLGHAWLDFPNRLLYIQQQQHCGLSLQASLSRDFLCSKTSLWSWTVHLHKKSLGMILKSEREKWTKAVLLHLMSPICSSLKGAKTPQRHCQSA